jgi:hypothetical protein
MLQPFACLVALSFVAVPGVAQERPPVATDVRSDAPSADQGLGEPKQVKGALVQAQGTDPLGRDQDGTQIDANAGRQTGSDAGIVTGNNGSVIQGGQGQLLPPDIFPADTSLPSNGDAGSGAGGAAAATGLTRGLDIDIAGFVDAGFSMFVFDNKDFTMTFLPRRLELNVDARWTRSARIFLDLGLSTSPASRPISAVSPTLDRDLVDALAEQAFAEWRGMGLTLRGGKLDRPFMNEPLDVTERTSLSRSTLSDLALPDTVTGLYADYELLPGVSVYGLVVNGWDPMDGRDIIVEELNRSKTFGGGLPHRLGTETGGDYLYEGNLAFLVGAEQAGVNDLTWVINYSGSFEVKEDLESRFELVYGGAQHQGFRQKDAKGGAHSAIWYGATASISWEGEEGEAGGLGGLKGDLRVEYLHDPDLFLDLPRAHNLPNLTTLLGVAATVRYALVRGFDAAIGYKVDFERGDVKNVSIQRNVSSPFRWFKTHELMFDLIGYF